MIKEIRQQHNELRQFVKWYNDLQKKADVAENELLQVNIDKNNYKRKLQKLASKQNKSFKLSDSFFFSDEKNFI